VNAIHQPAHDTHLLRLAASYQPHGALTRAEAPNGARRQCGESQARVGARPAFEGEGKLMPAVDAIGRWYQALIRSQQPIPHQRRHLLALLGHEGGELSR
jgi:hypothetical protein